mgnify:CR=1 FL=1
MCPATLTAKGKKEVNIPRATVGMCASGVEGRFLHVMMSVRIRKCAGRGEKVYVVYFGEDREVVAEDSDGFGWVPG